MEKNQVLTKKGVLIHRLNPDVIEKQNSVSVEKKKDVEKLLVNHFGENWRENPELKFYIQVIDDVSHGPVPEEELCEFVDRCLMN